MAIHKDSAGNEYDDGIDPNRETTLPLAPPQPREAFIPLMRPVPQPTPQPLYGPLPHRPHTCPVCGGKGAVRQGFYWGQGEFGVSTTSAPVPSEGCRSCGGTGVLWG